MKIITNFKYKMLSESNDEIGKLIRYLDKDFPTEVERNIQRNKQYHTGAYLGNEKTVVELAISLLIKYKVKEYAKN